MSLALLHSTAAAPIPRRRRSNAVWLADPASQESKPWFIAGLARSSSLGFLVGRGGAGKSTVALHLAMCLQEGKAFFGHAIPERGGTYFVDAEMQSDFRLRIEAAARQFGIPQAGRVLARHATKPDLSSKDGVDQFKRELQEVSEEMGECWGIPLRLVVLDTFGQTTLIQDENSAAHVNRVIDPLRRLAQELGIVFLFAHHIGRNGDWKAMRGAEALRDNADFTLHIQHSRAVQEFYLDKCKHGPGRRTLGHIRQIVVDLSDIEDDATACAIEEVAEWSPAKPDREPKASAVKAAKPPAVPLKDADSTDNIFLIAVEEIAGGGLPIKEVKTRFASLYHAAKGDVAHIDRYFNRAKANALEAGHVRLEGGLLHFNAASFEDAHPEMVTEEAKAMIGSMSDYGFVYSPEYQREHLQCEGSGLLATFKDAAEWSIDCADEEDRIPGLISAPGEPKDLRREFAHYVECRGALSPSSLERAFRYALKVATEGASARFELKNGRLAYRLAKTS